MIRFGLVMVVGFAKKYGDLREFYDADLMDRYDTQGGKLYRRNGMELELIRDFTDMEFEPIRAPYDWRQEGSDPWHPLKDTT